MRRYLPENLDVALLVLRIALAAVLLYHGLPKIMNFGATVSGSGRVCAVSSERSPRVTAA